MKHLITLNPRLPKTIRYPVDPETGKAWKERRDELQDLACKMQFDCETQEECDEVNLRYQALCEGVEFRECDYMAEIHLMLGAGANLRDTNTGKAVSSGKQRMFSVHPDVWAGWTDEKRDLFELWEPMKATPPLPPSHH